MSPARVGCRSGSPQFTPAETNGALAVKAALGPAHGVEDPEDRVEILSRTGGGGGAAVAMRTKHLASGRQTRRSYRLFA